MKIIILVLLTATMLVSCRRSDSAANTDSSQSARKSIMKYLNGLKASAHVDSLKDMLKNADVNLEEMAGRSIYVVEIPDNGTIKETHKVSRLIFSRNADSVTSGQVIRVGSNESGQNEIRKNFTGFFNGTFTPFTGTIYVSLLSFRPVSETVYKNGITIARAIANRLPASAGGAARISSEQCWKVFWIWEDSRGRETSRVLLYTYCEGGEEGAPDPYDSEAPTEAGGGSGGSGGEGEPCAPARMDQGVPVNEDMGADVVDIDEFTKEKNPNWVCHKGVTWAVLSYEKGLVKLDSAHSYWTWSSLVHNKLQKVGAAFGGQVTPNEGSSTPSFTAGTPNIRYASMKLDYSISYAPFYNCPIINLFTPSFIIPYQATSPFWNAIP